MKTFEWSLMKLSTQKNDTLEHIPWPDEIISWQSVASVRSISNSGRHVVIVNDDITNTDIALMDTVNMKTTKTPRQHKRARCCFISADDTKLFDFRHNHFINCIHLIIWQISADPTTVLIQELSRIEIAVPSFQQEVMWQVHMLPEETSCWIVSDRGVTEFWDLLEKKSAEAERETAHIVPPEKTYSHLRSSVSSDGTRLGVVSYGNRSAQVQILDITTTGQSLRSLKLTLSSPPINFSDERPITFSPDLGMLVIGTEIFHKGHHDDYVASKPISSWPIISMVENFPEWTISHYNSYAMYSFVGHDDDNRARYQFLRINLIARSIEPLNISIFGSSLYVFVDLHPSLPVELVTLCNPTLNLVCQCIVSMLCYNCGVRN